MEKVIMEVVSFVYDKIKNRKAEEDKQQDKSFFSSTRATGKKVEKPLHHRYMKDAEPDASDE